MYGFTAKSSVSRLNICQILMRYLEGLGGQGRTVNKNDFHLKLNAPTALELTHNI